MSSSDSQSEGNTAAAEGAAATVANDTSVDAGDPLERFKTVVKALPRTRSEVDEANDEIERTTPDEAREKLRIVVATTSSSAELLKRFGVGASVFATAKPTWPKFTFLCKALGIVPGAPALLVGYGFSGKTFLAQTLALCVAAGAPLFGKFDVSQGQVVHLDYEQGADLSSVRFHRLIKGLGLAPGALKSGALVYYAHPKFYLDDDDAEALLTELTQNKRLCIIDSLRAAVSPEKDENSAAFRSSLDVLCRVSGTTGCCFVVLHHAGKNAGSDKFAPRGSSAIFDAAGAVFQLDRRRPPVLQAHPDEDTERALLRASATNSSTRATRSRRLEPRKVSRSSRSPRER